MGLSYSIFDGSKPSLRSSNRLARRAQRPARGFLDSSSLSGQCYGFVTEIWRL